MADLEAAADQQVSRFATRHSEAIRDTEDPKDVETNRTKFKRDRDRILYTRAFRRMQFKTQVMTPVAGDHHRTRLTHSLEVLQLAGSLADALGLNRDLAEAIAIGHDVGHSPFGHAAERELHEMLIDRGGFSHAVQGVRCVEHLEKRLRTDGLNLCVQVREGILKHDADVCDLAESLDYKRQWGCDRLAVGTPSSLEGQLVYWADKIAYLSHDWEDFVKAGIMDDAIREGVLKTGDVEQVWRDVVGGEPGQEYPLRDLVRSLSGELLACSARNLRELNPSSATDAIERTRSRFETLKANAKEQTGAVKLKKLYPKALLIGLSDDFAVKVDRFRECLDKAYVKSPPVVRMDNMAKQVIGRIFEAFSKNPALMPLKTQATYRNAGGDIRVVADHIACMTDRYAFDTYRGLFVP